MGVHRHVAAFGGEVSVSAESEAEAGDAFKSWLQHVEAGRIGKTG